jgi:hypothetical protein
MGIGVMGPFWTRALMDRSLFYDPHIIENLPYMSFKIDCLIHTGKSDLIYKPLI